MTGAWAIAYAAADGVLQLYPLARQKETAQAAHRTLHVTYTLLALVEA